MAVRLTVAMASGKGGTGKTTVSTNLACAASETGYKVSYVDCDVEEPNGHLFLNPASAAAIRCTCRYRRFDINPGVSKSIEEKARARGITMAGRIHYDLAVTNAQVIGLPVAALSNTTAAKDIRKVWEKLVTKIN